MAVSDASPYVGLQAYGTDDTARFFGRARETWELTSLVLSSRLVVVYGPTGVGKSSLLAAGVLAGLGSDMAHVLPIGRPPRLSAFPTASVPDYNPFTYALLSSWAPDTSPATRLRGQSVSEFLQGVPVGTNRYDELLPLIAIIDQFEEVFTDVPQWRDRRNEFLEQLGEAIADIDHLQLVLSMKNDVVGEILPYESRLSAGNRQRFKLEPLSRDAALDAVTGPLRSTARSFASGVAEALVDDLRTTTITNAVGEQRTIEASTIEPVNLQVVCSALWRALPDDVTLITAEHVAHHGDIAETLTKLCVDAVREVAAMEVVPEPTVWEWLVRTFVTDLGTRGQAYEGIASTNGMLNAVARGLETRRILRSEKRSGSVWFELLHDGLILPIRRGRELSGALEASVGVDPSPTTYLRMAETALADGMLPLADEYASRAVSIGQHDRRTLAEAVSFLGKLASEQGRAHAGEVAEAAYTEAEEHYRRAAELFEIEQNARAVGSVLGSLGRLFRERGRTIDAVDALQAAINRSPGDLDLRMDLARALSDAGQAQAALSQYGALLTIAPESVEALVERAAISVRQADPASALADLDSAVRLQPEVADRPDVVTTRSQARAQQRRRRRE